MQEVDRLWQIVTDINHRQNLTRAIDEILQQNSMEGAIANQWREKQGCLKAGIKELVASV